MKTFRQYISETGSFALVGCGDDPNFKVWGARSDLGCRRKKKEKMLNMKFKEEEGRGPEEQR
jgi:hypothetical protein